MEPDFETIFILRGTLAKGGERYTVHLRKQNSDVRFDAVFDEGEENLREALFSYMAECYLEADVNILDRARETGFTVETVERVFAAHGWIADRLWELMDGDVGDFLAEFGPVERNNFTQPAM